MQKYVHTYKEASEHLPEYCNERKDLCVESLDEYMRACESIKEVWSSQQGTESDLKILFDAPRMFSLFLQNMQYTGNYVHRTETSPIRSLEILRLSP